MKTFILFTIVAASLVSGCAGVQRTKYSDKNMRVMIDPDSIDEDHLVQIQAALVESNRFTVVDRHRGLQAIKKEQELTHRVAGDRFEDKEKWAHWGKLYGIGAVVVPYANCTKEIAFFNHRKGFQRCTQTLQMVDANTGEIIVAVRGENTSRSTFEYPPAPDWDDIVTKLVDTYPRSFTTEIYHPMIQAYQAVSKEEAIRQKEEVAKDRKVAAETEKKGE